MFGQNFVHILVQGEESLGKLLTKLCSEVHSNLGWPGLSKLVLEYVYTVKTGQVAKDLNKLLKKVFNKVFTLFTVKQNICLLACLLACLFACLLAYLLA